MRHSGPHHFLKCLNAEEHARLWALGAEGMQAPPAGCVRWRCGDLPLGLLSPQRAGWLVQQLPDCSLSAQELVWQAGQLTPAQRSEQLQAVLLGAREQGLLTGWRNERFSFWHAECTTPEPSAPAFLSVERSGFRWLGMRSHAVHVNGFLPDGRLWCARRADSKPTDPGLLDNLAAGGLPTGETVLDCLQRELAEEAGLFSLDGLAVQAMGSVRTTRLEPQGWHDEVLHVFNLHLNADWVPQNQDGEVAEFLCLTAQQVLTRMLGRAFTVDAVQTLLQGLRD